MGLYTNNLSGYGFGDTSFESLEENTSLNINENMSLVEAAMNSIAITEENWNAIQREIALTELAYVEETGEDFVYNEATGTSFIDTVKGFFKNIWEKIKALFRKFLVILGSYTKNDKDFVKKYSKDIVAAMKNIPSEASIKGYNYTLGEYKNKLSKPSVTEVINFSQKLCGGGDFATIGAKTNYDYAEVMEAARAEVLGISGGLTSSEFNEEMYKLLRGKEDSKIDIDLDAGLVNQAMNELNNMKTIRKEAKDAYNALSKIFTKVDKELTDMSKKVTKDLPNKDDKAAKLGGDVLTGVNRVMGVAKGMAGVLQTANGIFLSACKEASRQYKAICVKVVTYKNIKESGYLDDDDYYNESAGTDMFAGVVLR